jgi:hypothetical protein
MVALGSGDGFELRGVPFFVEEQLFVVPKQLVVLRFVFFRFDDGLVLLETSFDLLEMLLNFIY